MSTPERTTGTSTLHRATYTVQEAAQVLGVGRGLAYEMVRRGAIPSLRLGERRIVVPRQALESLLTAEALAS